MEVGLIRASFFPVFSLLFESFFIRLLLAECCHISTLTTLLQRSTILSRRDFLLFFPVSNEELLPTKLILLFGQVPDEKQIFREIKR